MKLPSILLSTEQRIKLNSLRRKAPVSFATMKQEELCLVLTICVLTAILYYSWEQVVQGGHNISCPLCKLQIPTQEMMKLGEVTKTEGEWIEKFLSMNLEESLNAPHDLSHCLNQVLQASPVKEIFDLNNNRLEIPELRACPSCQTMVEHTVGCYKMTCVGCSSSFCFICLKVRTAETACPTTMEMFRCETACKQTL